MDLLTSVQNCRLFNDENVPDREERDRDCHKKPKQREYRPEGRQDESRNGIAAHE